MQSHEPFRSAASISLVRFTDVYQSLLRLPPRRLSQLSVGARACTLKFNTRLMCRQTLWQTTSVSYPCQQPRLFALGPVWLDVFCRFVAGSQYAIPERLHTTEARRTVIMQMMRIRTRAKLVTEPAHITNESRPLVHHEQTQRLRRFSVCVPCVQTHSVNAFAGRLSRSPSEYQLEANCMVYVRMYLHYCNGKQTPSHRRTLLHNICVNDGIGHCCCAIVWR